MCVLVVLLSRFTHDCIYVIEQCGGAGFVLLGTTDECDGAISALSGTHLEGAINPLALSYAHNNVSLSVLQCQVFSLVCKKA